MAKKDIVLEPVKNDKPKKITRAEFIALSLSVPFTPKANHDWIVVDEFLVKPLEKTKAGIYLTPTEKKDDIRETIWEEHPSQGLVKSVGDKVDGIKKGDYVYLIQTPKRAILWNGKWFALVQRPDIAVILDE